MHRTLKGEVCPRALLLAALLLSTTFALAQTSTVKGTVTDPSGAVVAGATVSVHLSTDASVIKSARSASNGAYQIDGLTPNSFEIEVSAAGFKTTKSNLSIPAGQVVVRDVALSLAGTSTQISVTDTSNPAGSYKVEVSSLGPLGNVELLDTPYTVTTVPTNLMENEGVRKFSDVLKYLPGAQMEPRGGMDVGRPQTRGFEGSVIQNSRMDGLNIIDTTTYPMEQFDRIEVQSGLAGSLYGATAPAGIFNFVLKRPTEATTAKLSLDLDSPTTTTINGDAGGMITKYFGYRVDALHTNGTGWVDGSHHRREMLSASVDIHIDPNNTFQFNGSEFDTHDHGFAGGFGYSSSVTINKISTPFQFPAAPDPTRVGYGQSWAGQDLSTRTVSGRYLHSFSDKWSVTMGGLHQSAARPGLTVSNKFTNNSGSYTQTASDSYSLFFADSNIVYINGHFTTGKIAHDVVLGTNGYVWRSNSAGTSPTLSTYSYTDSLAAPSEHVMPAITGSFGKFYKSFTSSDQSVVASDTIHLARRWMAQFIGSEVIIHVQNFGSTGTASGTAYNVNGFAPSASLMYKPAENMTAYFTYASSLYLGDSATNTSTVVYTNAGLTLPPYRSKQYEAGYKWNFRGAELSLAAYRMTRPMPTARFISTTGTVSTYTYEIEGTQQNDGLDFMAKGKILPNLNVFGGFTWLNPTLQDTGDLYTASNGKQVTGAPRIQSNFLAEYEIPGVRGLTVNGNWHHTGDKAANDTNTMVVPKYNTFDLGARYDQRFKYGDATWRFSATNIGNAKYWYGVFPGSINGTDASYTAFLGAPRVISASLQWRFTKER